MDNKLPDTQLNNYRYASSPPTLSPTLAAPVVRNVPQLPHPQIRDIVEPQGRVDKEPLWQKTLQEGVAKPSAKTRQLPLLRWRSQSFRSIEEAHTVWDLRMQLFHSRKSWDRFRFDSTPMLHASMCACDVITHGILRMQDLLENLLEDWAQPFSVVEQIASWKFYLESSPELDWFEPFLSIWSSQAEVIDDPARLFSCFNTFNKNWQEKAESIGLKNNIRNTILSSVWTQMLDFPQAPTLQNLVQWSTHCSETSGALPPREACSILQLRSYAELYALSERQILTCIYQLPLFWAHPTGCLPDVNIPQSEIYHSFARWLFRIPQQLSPSTPASRRSTRMHLFFLLDNIRARSWQSLSLPNPSGYYDLKTYIARTPHAELSVIITAIDELIHRI